MSRITATNRGVRTNLVGVNNENPGRVTGKGAVGQPTAKTLGLGGVMTRRALASATNVAQQALQIKKEDVFKKPLVVKSQSYGSLKPDQVVKSQRIKDENDVVQALSLTTLAVDNVMSKIPGRLTSLPELKEEFAGFSGTFLLPQDVEDIDVNDGGSVFLATEYVNDIYRYLRFLERKQSVSHSFLSIQKEMTPKMRSVLVDWLVNIHHQFKLLPETLYMGVSLMDRFFEKQAVCKDKIQLVGVTAFMIAAKFEEIYPPDLNDFVLMCDQLYSKRDILKMETVMLSTIKFEIGRPLPLHFLRRNSKAAHADPMIHTMAKYLMELTLTEHVCAHWLPSVLAAASLYVTLKILSTPADMDDEECRDPIDGKWTPTLAFYSGYSEAEIIPYAAQLCKVIQRSEKSRFQNVRKKFMSSKNLSVARSPLLKCTFIEELAAMAV